MDVGTHRLAGDTARAATTDGVEDLRREARDLKEVVAEQAPELRMRKRAYSRMGGSKSEISRIREARDHQSGGATFPS